MYSKARVANELEPCVVAYKVYSRYSRVVPLEAGGAGAAGVHAAAVVVAGRVRHRADAGVARVRRAGGRRAHQLLVERHVRGGVGGAQPLVVLVLPLRHRVVVGVEARAVAVAFAPPPVAVPVTRAVAVAVAPVPRRVLVGCGRLPRRRLAACDQRTIMTDLSIPTDVNPSNMSILWNVHFI